MDIGGGEVGLDLGGDVIDHLDGHEVGTGDAVVAVARDLAFGTGSVGAHRGPRSVDALRVGVDAVAVAAGEADQGDAGGLGQAHRHAGGSR